MKALRATLAGRDRPEPDGHVTRRAQTGALLPAFLILVAAVSPASANPIVIGSKKFTESYVLGEIAQRALNDAGVATEHRQGMGGTIILWQALRGGQIDAYPEYTGTIAQEILKNGQQPSFQEIRDALGKFGVGMTEPLGFNNTYALVMRRSEAQRLGVRTISDLRKHPELKIGLTHEFLDRQDGWRPLRERYGLPQQSVIGIDHALGYAALANGSIDVKDAYSTDAKIEENDLVVLEDDLRFFPKYEAVFLFRSSMSPDAISALRRLEGTLDEKRMIHLNMEAERTKNYTFAANLYFEDGERSANSVGESFPHKLARWTLRHLELAGFSLLLSVIIGIPLGIVASRGGVDWAGNSWLCQHCANDPVARLAGVACPSSVFRDQRCALRSLRCSFTGYCRSCGTLRAACRIFRDRYENLLLRWDSVHSPGSGRFICRWHRARFSRESKPAR